MNNHSQVWIETYFLFPWAHTSKWNGWMLNYFKNYQTTFHQFPSALCECSSSPTPSPLTVVLLTRASPVEVTPDTGSAAVLLGASLIFSRADFQSADLLRWSVQIFNFFTCIANFLIVGSENSLLIQDTSLWSDIYFANICSQSLTYYLFSS